ncbi:glycosyltransferase [Candidatus Woesearchaeota archaeon]|nr:glycosyltransferase [Candidatus Woesearchaeota archaeon]
MTLKNVSQSRSLSDKIVIATSTLYNPDLESDILRSEIAKNTIRQSTSLGYETIIVDCGSHDKLLKEFERYGAKVSNQKEKGMGNAKRQAIQEALDTKKEIITWTEPEKQSFIKDVSKTAEPILENRADIVIPKRKSLKSYPVAQQYAEHFGNLFWKTLTGHDFDMWFGPRTWKRELSDYFLNYKSEYGDKWDIFFLPIIDMMVDKKKLLSVEVNYTHPKKQTRLEEHSLEFCKKRIYQLDNLTKAIEDYWDKRHKT